MFTKLHTKRLMIFMRLKSFIANLKQSQKNEILNVKLSIRKHRIIYMSLIFMSTAVIIEIVGLLLSLNLQRTCPCQKMNSERLIEQHEEDEN